MTRACKGLGLMRICVGILQGAGAAGPNAGSSDSRGAPADSEQQQSESDVDDDDAGCASTCFRCQSQHP
jgi:hypothetical protein